MLVIHFRNQQRHIFVHAKRRRVADHRITGRGETSFRFARDLARQTRKYEIAIEWRRGRLHRHRANRRGHFTAQTPRARFAIRLSLRTIGRRNSGDFKLRMVLEQLNEPLAHHSRRAENSDSILYVQPSFRLQTFQTSFLIISCSTPSPTFHDPHRTRRAKNLRFHCQTPRPEP